MWDLDPGDVQVDDCYAFNVGHDEVLACSYVDFPVVRIRNRQATAVATNGISGPTGIIASGDRVGLIGTYGDPSLLITGTIRDGAFRKSKCVKLRAPDGTSLPVVRPCCRGSVAHFFGEQKWYSIDLDDVT